MVGSHMSIATAPIFARCSGVPAPPERIQRLVTTVVAAAQHPRPLLVIVDGQSTPGPTGGMSRNGRTCSFFVIIGAWETVELKRGGGHVA